jgi:hypothetical protein
MGASPGEAAMRAATPMYSSEQTDSNSDAKP